MEKYRILAINPGSTSTKIAVYECDNQIMESTLRHSNEDIDKYPNIMEQYAFRKAVILGELEENGVDLKSLSAVVGRGGLLKPISGGTYSVNDEMLKDLKDAKRGEHASNLGAILAHEIAGNLDIPAYIVDPVVVDELQDVARLSGIKEIERISIFHALNQKAVARRAAEEMNKKYEDMNLIVAHLGGGVSVGAHLRGRVIDVNNALDGDGPFSPERSGEVPTDGIIKFATTGKYSHAEFKKMIKGAGGLVAYLGTNDGREIQKRIEGGDEKAKLVYEAMAYQVSKEIGRCAGALKGDVDAIILTGGLAYDKGLVAWIKERVDFIANVIVYAGEDEMSALAKGGLRILSGEESPKVYA